MAAFSAVAAKLQTHLDKKLILWCSQVSFGHAWNWMQLMHHTEDFQVEPAVGPGEMTSEEARAAVQGMLDGLVQKFPDLDAVAERWRRGAGGNTVSYQVLAWAVYQHEPGEVSVGAQAWLEEAAARDRANGIDTQVARFRNSE